MTTKTKQIIGKSVNWTMFVVVVILLVSAPSIYLKTHGGTTDGVLAACGGQSANLATDPDVAAQQIMFNHTVWQQKRVEVTGQLAYSQSRDLYYLSDGMFTIPLDPSQCQDLSRFNDDMLVVAHGQVIISNGQPIIVVNGLRQIAPPILQTFYNAGTVGLFIVFALIIYAIVVVLRFLVRRSKRKAQPATPAPPPAPAKNRSGFISLMLALMALIFWLINPVISLLALVWGIGFGAAGLRTVKRKQSLVGLILCLIGLGLGIFFFIGLGQFNRASGGFFYLSGFADTATKPTGQELLEINPYINSKYQISLHQPKDWVADDSGTDNTAVVFKGPEFGTLDGKPLYMKIAVNITQANGVDTSTLFTAVKDQLAKSYQNFKMVQESDGVLAGGRLNSVHFFEATFTNNGISTHGLGFVTIVNGVAYAVAGSTPQDHWSQYEPAIRQSLHTFEAVVTP